MEENNLKELWFAAAGGKNIEINADRLIASINQKISKMERQIKRRDSIEIIVCAGMIPVFSWFFFKLPQALGKTGAAIIVAACILVIYKLVMARKTEVRQDIASELNHHLAVSLQLVQKQISMLDTMLWWYLMPFFSGVLCFYYVFPVSLLSKGCYTFIVAILYGYIYFLNKKVVRKKLKPLEVSISKILEDLTKENT